MILKQVTHWGKVRESQKGSNSQEKVMKSEGKQREKSGSLNRLPNLKVLPFLRFKAIFLPGCRIKKSGKFFSGKIFGK